MIILDTIVFILSILTRWGCHEAGGLRHLDRVGWYYGDAAQAPQVDSSAGRMGAVGVLFPSKTAPVSAKQKQGAGAVWGGLAK